MIYQAKNKSEITFHAIRETFSFVRALFLFVRDTFLFIRDFYSFIGERKPTASRRLSKHSRSSSSHSGNFSHHSLNNSSDSRFVHLRSRVESKRSLMISNAKKNKSMCSRSGSRRSGIFYRLSGRGNGGWGKVTNNCLIL